MSMGLKQVPAKDSTGGAEEQAMHGTLGRLFGKYTEEMFFEGDQSALNPMRYLPTPFHTKFAQQRTALSQYIQQEAVGTRMRRWERPLHDFLFPYVRGTVERATGINWIPAEVQHRRDLDTLTDMMTYLRALNESAKDQVPSPPAHIKSPRAGGGPAVDLRRTYYP